MSYSRTLAFTAVVVAGLVTAACSSDPTAPKPSFSCEGQGSNTAQGCLPSGPH